MALNYRRINRIRLNVHLLETRVQPGSWFTTGLALGAGRALGAGLLTPPQDRPRVSVVQRETFGGLPRRGQATVPQQGEHSQSTLHTVAHADELLDHAQLRTALFTNAAFADPLALETSPRPRLVRQPTDNGVVARHGERVDVSALSAHVSAHSRAIARAVVMRSEAEPRAVPLGLGTDSHTSAESTVSEAPKQTIAENYGQLPLSFEQNVGQFDERVDFVARTGGMTTFLTPTAAVFAVQNSESRIQNSESEPRPLGSGFPGEPLADARGSDKTASFGVALYMEVVGANPSGRAAGVNPLSGTVNYFIGNDPSQWHTNIATFGRVEYQDVYPEIDLVYYGSNGALEYDFIVSPGADPNVIALNFAGADGVEVDAQGNLVLHTAAGDVVQQKPLTYQQHGGSRQEIASRYVLNGTNVRFEVGAYDSTQPLVIDPLVLGYSTFLGGGGGDDSGHAIAVDTAGNAYVTGYTYSTKFPMSPGAFDTSYNGLRDAFVAKLSADGASLVYGTYIGGSDFDQGNAIAVDAAGNAYVTGETWSTDFPTTLGAFDTSYNGGHSDAFFAKLSAGGTSLGYATYVGGSSSDAGYGIAVDVAGNAYVTGSLDGAIVGKLSADGAILDYDTYLGGSGADIGLGIALDAVGNAYVTGYTNSVDFSTTPGAFDTSPNAGLDAFVAKLSADGASLTYGTYLGGSGNDHAYGIAVDAAGNAYVTGYTNSTDFPTVPGAFDTSYNNGSDAFVAKLSADGASLTYGTYLGGSSGDEAYRIAVDAAGNASVTGVTLSTNFPTTSGAFDASYNGGGDAFVAKLSPRGTRLDYGSYLGGSSQDAGYAIAVDAAGNAYVTGITLSTNFPTTPGALKRRNRGANDAFVTKFAEV